MIRLLIIADDFTGALDTGVKFAECGARTRVVTDYEYQFGTAEDGVQVLVMDAETRHISKEEAYCRVYQAVKRAKNAGIPYVYKKTDSALRGNIGGELTAVLDGVGGTVLHFVPALPRMRRITKGGIHYIDGIPVHDSVFGKDPFEPVLYSDIRKIIREQSRVNVKIISDKSVEKGCGEPLIAVYDAETTQDLQLLAEKLAADKQLGVLAGCSGLADVLPSLLGLTGAPLQIPKFANSFLVACGSVNPITKNQLDYAEKKGFQRVRLLPHQKLEPEYFQTSEGKRFLEELMETCLNVKELILDTNDVSETENTMKYASMHGIKMEELRIRISRALGYVVKYMVDRGIESTLLITGGDSLLGFMKQMNVFEMTPICEMAPGTVLSRCEFNGKNYHVISKSGGFGTETLLTDLADKLFA